MSAPDEIKATVAGPTAVEQARRILREAHKNTLERLVLFVVENEEFLVQTSQREYDASGTMERLTAIHQEIFVLGNLLGSLPAPAQPAPPPPKPPVENKSP